MTVDSWYWPQPKHIPWDQIRLDAWQSAMMEFLPSFHWTSDTTASFAKWSDQVERSLHGFSTSPHGKLPPGTCGRGQHRKAKKGNPLVHRIKPNRPGEVHMPISVFLIFTCPGGIVSFVVCKAWFMPVAVVRLMSMLLHTRPSVGPALSGHLDLSPTSVHGGLVAVKLQSSPDQMQGLPTLATLELIFADFRLNYQHLEDWHRRKRAQLAQARKECHSKELFRALRPDCPEALDFLTSTSQFQILVVDSSTGAVQLNADIPSFVGCWTLQGEHIHPVPVVNLDFLESDRTWCLFESDCLPIPGQKIQQTLSITEVPAIHDALLKFWLPRWQNMTHVPADAWDRVVQFTKAFIPKGHLRPAHLGLADYRRAFKKGSALRTAGPDGWQKADVLALPDCMLADMVKLYTHVEQGRPWPQQLTRGHVFCLQKDKNNFEPGNFRPVVLFSIWYRLWSSLQSRHYLSQLEQVANFPAFGFLSGRGCRDLTYAVQTSIELALGQNAALCGGLFDIEKCFNFIPRGPVMFLAKWFGVDDGVICGWTSFLSAMHRAFVIRHEPSDAVCSDNGLPEGDGLSCLGMVLLDFSFHFYMRHFQPQLAELSFVYNLELVARHPDSLVAGVVTLESWIHMFRLRIDSKKSQYWALTSPHRRHLQSLGLSVFECASDLGATMSFSAKHLNRPLRLRILQSMPFWAKLRTLNVSPWHKLQAIRMALLPRSLHASNAVCLGDSWFVKLRTQVMRAMKVSRAGANPVIRVAFICGVDMDPGFYDPWQCFRDFLKYYQTNTEIRRLWLQYVNTPGLRKTHGPFAKVLKLFASLGWEHQLGQSLQLAQGFLLELAWLDMGIAKKLLTHYWQQMMVASVAKRQDFHGLDD